MIERRTPDVRAGAARTPGRAPSCAALRAAVPVLLFLLPCTMPLSAQDASMVTDRPDFTESPATVPVGSVQIETGFTWERLAGTGATTLPEALIRWSPASGFEVRIGVPNWLDTPLAQGFGDLGLGVKFELGRFAEWDAGIIAAATVPTGSDGNSAGEVEPQVILTAGRDLGLESSLGVQVAATGPAGSDGVHLLSTIVVGRTLSSQVGSFLELAVERGSGGGSASLLHGGFTYAVSRTVQLDVHAAAGLSGSAPDGLIGFGFSTRLD